MNGNPSRSLPLILSMLRMRLSRQMMYRASFWTAFFVDGTLFLMQLVFFSTLFLQVDSINGWSREQLVFFVGTFSIIDGLEMCLYFFGLISLPDKIRSGKLDLYLTKPISPLFHITFEGIDVGSGFLALPGVVMVVWATLRLGIDVTVWHVAGYLFLLGLMLVLLYDMVLIMRTLAFWVIQVDALGELEGELMGFAFRVPGIVFQGVFRLLFCVFLPYALLATLPTQFFTDGLSWTGWLGALLITGAFSVFAGWLWKRGLAQYESTGS